MDNIISGWSVTRFFQNLLQEAVTNYTGANKPLPEMGKFIDPLTDWGFRHLFGNNNNKEILIEFLNDLFEGQKTITDLQFANNELDGTQTDHKRVIFDLHCKADDGELFIVEMQRIRQAHFKDRSLFYLSQLIQDQLDKGKTGQNYQLPEIYFIGILDFVMDTNNHDQYLHDIILMDRETSRPFYNKLGLKFLEIPNFAKKQQELQSNLDKWMYLLKHLQNLDQIPKYLDKRIFSTIFKLAEIAKLKKEDQMVYRTDWMREMDRKAVLDYAREQGKTEMVKKLIADFGFTIEQAAQAAELSIEKIKEILK